MKKFLPALLSIIIAAFAQGAYAQGGVLPINGSVKAALPVPKEAFTQIITFTPEFNIKSTPISHLNTSDLQ